MKSFTKYATHCWPAGLGSLYLLRRLYLSNAPILLSEARRTLLRDTHLTQVIVVQVDLCILQLI